MTLPRAGTADGRAGLDAILADPAHALIVCSRSPEAPRVAAAADIVVDGPGGVVYRLSALADAMTDAR